MAGAEGAADQNKGRSSGDAEIANVSEGINGDASVLKDTPDLG